MAATRSIRLNEYQSDVLLGALKTEIQRVQSDTATPRSLKLLALKELEDIRGRLEGDGVPVEPLSCAHCDRVFDSAQGLSMHMTRTHPQYKS